ncbi:hypothetical protein RHGRI_037968 [Rhododendron griersonianum]|uniref:DDE Tnp4 domain-containing protein n=1 Tax=Rhododendron griersonianum TaxID=479676 RepID=A0AAV6HXC2_9ERIC|nr:hypothetical protein RHGRI_037968 [Rhododendron griersonianum]
MSVDPTFLDDDLSSGSGEDVNMLDGHKQRQSTTPNSGRRKRSRKATGDAIVDAMLEIAAASKMRATEIMKNEDRFSISKCIKVLDEMQIVDQRLYFFALDLFENPNGREIFIALKSEKRLTWLQGKFGASSGSFASFNLSVKCSFINAVLNCTFEYSTDLSTGMEDFELELDEMELVAAAAGYHYYNSLTKQPRCSRNESPCGTRFMVEVLNGDDDGCREMFRMDKHVFHKLCGTLRQKGMLRDTPGVMIEEQLGIFLNIVGHNERNRVIQERFEHSGETISRHFNNVLKAVKSLSREFLQPPPISTPIEILSSNRFHPYFKVYVMWLFSDILHITGKYYLVDSGYSNTEGFIAPFEGIRHHIHDYRGANLLPRNAKELFNHRHSCLRNAIQKSFEVLRRRFPILKVAPQYAFHIQRDIVIAACVLHNLIRREERNDWLFAAAAAEGPSSEDLPDLEDGPEMLASPVEGQIASSLRDFIATAMWNDFITKWDEW